MADAAPATGSGFMKVGKAPDKEKLKKDLENCWNRAGFTPEEEAWLRSVGYPEKGIPDWMRSWLLGDPKKKHEHG